MALGTILTAIATPFDADLRVDEESFVALHRYVCEHGSDGVVACGSTGEAATLSDEEHLRVVELACTERPDGTTVVAGTGSNDTAHAVWMTEKATELGVDAVLVVTPYYVRPNRRGIVRHYEAVAAATDKPVILYNIPSRTGTDMPNDLLAELAQIENIAGVKQANNDNLAPVDGLDVYAGNDETFASTLDMGGAGGICVASHVVGDEMRRMVDEPDARGSINAELQDVFTALSVTTNPIPIKAALNLLGHDVGGLRLPLVEADEHETAVVREMLERHGLLEASTIFSGTLRILPLGGLGEIGKNMTVLEYEDRIIVVDTGLRFPTAEMPGVDLVLPDFSYLRDRSADIEAIVITHAHEDHVGALPWVLKEMDDPPPVYGGRLTMAMARSRLDEHRLRDIELEDVDAGEIIEAGPFTLETIHMTHSIPDARAVAVTTELGTVLITGDYKFDQTPVDQPTPDLSRLARLGDAGLLALCGDSTNADRAGWSISEATVGPHLEQVIDRAPGRVVVTSFASNVHRVQQVVRAAAALDRKVALVGRSMKKYVNIAKSLGHMEVPDGILIQPREMDQFPDHKLVIMSTGSQGEPGSALRRMAHNDHPAVELRKGDTVVFSATPIPGNERAINDTVDRLFKLGCTVVTARDAPIHASGHGYVEEIKLMANLTRPRYLLPVHGDHKRIRIHGQLAEAVGVKADNIFRGENGLPLEIDAKGARFGSKEQSGMIFVDGLDIGDVNDAALRDRRMLSADGIFVVVATISEQTGQSVADPEVIFRGVPFTDEAEKLLDALRDCVDESLKRAAKEEIREVDLLEKVLHDDLGKFVYDRLKRRPMVLPVVVEV